MSNKNWQDIMIQHSISKDWIGEALGKYNNEETGKSSIEFCGRLCETILDQQQKLDLAIEVIKKQREGTEHYCSSLAAREHCGQDGRHIGYMTDYGLARKINQQTEKDIKKLLRE